MTRCARARPPVRLRNSSQGGQSEGRRDCATQSSSFDFRDFSGLQISKVVFEGFTKHIKSLLSVIQVSSGR